MGQNGPSRAGCEVLRVPAAGLNRPRDRADQSSESKTAAPFGHWGWQRSPTTYNPAFPSVDGARLTRDGR
ncbi:MAG: hypothetical protein AAF684_05830, partial [Pseudomonadota bacterium]